MIFDNLNRKCTQRENYNESWNMSFEILSEITPWVENCSLWPLGIKLAGDGKIYTNLIRIDYRKHHSSATHFLMDIQSDVLNKSWTKASSKYNLKNKIK